MPDGNRSTDAYGRFDLKTAVPCAKELSQYDLFQPFGGVPDSVRVVNSVVTLPELPGIGFEGKADLYAEMKALVA